MRLPLVCSKGAGRTLWTVWLALQTPHGRGPWLGCLISCGRGLLTAGRRGSHDKQLASRAPLISQNTRSHLNQGHVSPREPLARAVHWSGWSHRQETSNFWSSTIPLHPSLCSPLIFTSANYSTQASGLSSVFTLS